MNGLDNHYANMLADHQRMLDEQAQKEEEEEDLTTEDMAFVDSYARCVAVGTREDVMHFLRPTNKHVMPDYIFTSIEDAWLVWDDALKFARGDTK